jgi:hypothetical protein
MASSLKTSLARDDYITVCANCSLMKITETHWITITKKFESQFKDKEQISHGMCPKCMEALYGDLFSNNLSD